MSIDYRARFQLDERLKAKKEEAMQQKIASMSDQLKTIEKSMKDIPEGSSSSEHFLTVNAALLACIQQSNSILFTILDKLATADDIKTLQKTLIEALHEVKDAIHLLKEPKKMTTKNKKER